MKRTHPVPRWLAVPAMIGAAIATIATVPVLSQAANAQGSSAVLGCYTPAGTTGLHALSVSTSGRCSTSTSKLTWNLTGPAGLQGATGPQGPTRSSRNLRGRRSDRDPGTRRSTRVFRTGREQLGDLHQWRLYTAPQGDAVQIDIQVYCPGGDELLGGGTQSNDSSAQTMDSGPYTAGGVTYPIWNADFYIRYDSSQNETGTVSVYAICGQIAGISSAALERQHLSLARPLVIHPAPLRAGAVRAALRPVA